MAVLGGPSLMALHIVLVDDMELVLHTLSGEIVIRRPTEERRRTRGRWRELEIDGPREVQVERRKRTDRRPA